MDAVHYKVHEEGLYISKAIYTLLGLTVGGNKEILGIYLSDNESASYWLSVLTKLQNRGLEDIMIASIDGLNLVA
jgi:putative transposase